MSHRHHFLARTITFGEFLVEPNDVFLLDRPVAHLQIRAGRITYKYIITRLDDEAVVFPKIDDGFAGTFRPVGLVVARNEEIGHLQRLELVIYVLQLGIGSHIGYVRRQSQSHIPICSHSRWPVRDSRPLPCREKRAYRQTPLHAMYHPPGSVPQEPDTQVRKPTRTNLSKVSLCYTYVKKSFRLPCRETMKPPQDTSEQRYILKCNSYTIGQAPIKILSVFSTKQYY